MERAEAEEREIVGNWKRQARGHTDSRSVIREGTLSSEESSPFRLRTIHNFGFLYSLYIVSYFLRIS